MRYVLARLAGPGLVAVAMGAAAARLILRTGNSGEGADLAAAGAEIAPGSVALAGGGTAVMMAAAAAAVAVVAARLAGRVPGAWLTGGGAVCAGAGLWAAAGASGGAAQTAALILAAAGFAPAAGLQRVMITESAEALSPLGRSWPARDEDGHEIRYALYSWHWAAVTIGGGCVLALSMLHPVAPHAVLRVCGITASAGGLLTLLRPPPSSVGARDGIAVLDGPWARRSIAAAFGLGALFAGGVGPGQGLLWGEWQRSPRGVAGVMAAAAAGAAAAAVFGRWFHHLNRRRGAARAGAAGAQLMIGGGAALLGALSFTYIGLIACWALACGALALAAAGLDAATWAGMRPSVRQRVAARQVAGFALGACLAAALAAGPLAGRHDQMKTAAMSLPCIVVGCRMARRCPPAEKPGPERRAWNRSVPRRVAPDPDGPLLQLVEMGVAYDDVQVVFGANLIISQGQIVALLGTNGAGKTTTLRAISGLEPVCAGRIRYRGLDITRTPPTWRVGMGLHQIVGGEAVATGLTVEDNLRLFSHSVIGPRADAGIAAALRRFPRLEERRSQSAATLSGGEKQMLALAKAFIVKPRLLMIDEFSLGLAPALVAELVPVLRSIAERGAAVLLVEQSMNVVRGLADYAYVMDKGEIRSEGPTADWEITGDLVRSVYLAGSRDLAGSRTRVNSPERADPLRPGDSGKLERPQ